MTLGKLHALMDHALNPEERAYRRELQRFLDAELSADAVRETDENRGPRPASRIFLKKMGAKGHYTMDWPKEFGGQEKSRMHSFIRDEEVAYYGAPDVELEVKTVARCIMLFGTEWQKKTFLPKIARGELVFTAGYTEPDAGSDLASLKLPAVRDGDDYVLNGQKRFTSEIYYADYIWMAVRTDPKVPKHKGISVLLVDVNTPGITVRPMMTMSEERTNETFYDNVRVPATHLVGRENEGWPMLTTALRFVRNIPSGDLVKLIEEVTQYAAVTVVDGEPLIKKPIIRNALAEFILEVKVLRLFGMNTARALSRNIAPGIESSVAKLFRLELAQRLAHFNMEMMGQYAQLQKGSPDAPLNGDLERFYRSVIRWSIAGGTKEVQRNIIAQAGLGLPKGN